MRAGVLHTVPALVPVFHGLLTGRRDDLDIVHVADPSLLARAVASGITDDVVSDIRGHLDGLRATGARAVLVTCSSIGEAAAEAARSVGLTLVRVDAAMAATAVERARSGSGRVLVLATLPATLGPTSRLVGAAASGTEVDVTAHVVEGAAAARSAGDQQRHDALIADAIREASGLDVIVLAQASMAPGAGDDPRVLTSPESGAEAFVAALRSEP
ncbi:aspartate/glutamate racemase family protein [Microbacterium yannicii]|uniref:aspartate/glutamate racemase family protein n=1 Tax=Microbacterium yannicii TaxID=671622 RepID=UPI0003182385|nr:aspartate/glutamate racemase family protein [Microbacterium yannicii]